jgi:hypothetical protein
MLSLQRIAIREGRIKKKTVDETIISIRIRLEKIKM